MLRVLTFWKDNDRWIHSYSTWYGAFQQNKIN